MPLATAVDVLLIRRMDAVAATAVAVGAFVLLAWLAVVSRRSTRLAVLDDALAAAGVLLW